MLKSISDWLKVLIKRDTLSLAEMEYDNSSVVVCHLKADEIYKKAYSLFKKELPSLLYLAS